MTAICKTIAVHGEHLSSLLDYGADIEKTSLLGNDALSNLFDYAKNESKTSFVDPLNDEKSILVTGVKCSPETANKEFKDTRDLYPDSKRGLGNKQSRVIAIHLIQSFKETNISPIIAHKIGIELLERNGYMGVVDTHMNKTHIHNHIIINSYIPGGDKKIILEKKFLMNIRKFSDDLQKEYGIPIDFESPTKQLEKSKDSLQYGEWAAQRKNKSWKADLYESMLICSASSSSKEEYIKLLKRFGYTLAKQQRNGDLVWFNLDKTKKIKESTLYREFTDSTLRQFNHSSIHFDYLETRYSWDGRELNNIENTLRKTYNIICAVANYISNSHSIAQLKSYNLEYKKSELTWASNIKGLYSVDTIKELDEKLNSVGTSISIIKKQIKDIESIKDYYHTIAEYSSSAKLLKQSFINQGGQSDLLNELYLPHISALEASENNATIAPLSSTQKRDLHILMATHPDYRIVNAQIGYRNLSTVDYFNIVKYFKYGGELPGIMCNRNSFNHDMAYKNQYDFLSKKFPFAANPRQIGDCKKLLVDAGYDITKINLKSLTLADVINIQNCLGPAPTLEDTKDITSPSVNDINRCVDICKQKGIVPPMHPKDMSSKQCNIFYSWACSQGNDPRIIELQSKHINDDKAFSKSIMNLKPELQTAIRSYRNAVIKLHKIGLSPDDIDVYINQFENIDEHLNSLKLNQTTLNKQYKDLIHLKQILYFSHDLNYVYGSPKLRDEYFELKKKDLSFENNQMHNNQSNSSKKKDKELDIDI